MHGNNVCHFAIHAEDLDRAKQFYENVFGWRFEEWGPPDFYLIQTGTPEEPGIRGALQKRQSPVGDSFNGFEVDIVEHGGKIVFEEVEIPTVGRIVKFEDTEKNVVCAIQYAEGVVHG